MPAPKDVSESAWAEVIEDLSNSVPAQEDRPALPEKSGLGSVRVLCNPTPDSPTVWTAPWVQYSHHVSFSNVNKHTTTKLRVRISVVEPKKCICTTLLGDGDTSGPQCSLWESQDISCCLIAGLPGHSQCLIFTLAPITDHISETSKAKGPH